MRCCIVCVCVCVRERMFPDKAVCHQEPNITIETENTLTNRNNCSCFYSLLPGWGWQFFILVCPCHSRMWLWVFNLQISAAMIRDVTPRANSPDTIYANPASSVSSLQHPPHPPLSAGLKCKALMSAHFPAHGLTGMTPNALCPLPNLRGEKSHIWNPFRNLSSETQGWATEEKTRNKAEIDFMCFSISSHGLSGTRCHLLFSGQAWGSIAESDTVQHKVYSRTDMQEFRTKLCSD